MAIARTLITRHGPETPTDAILASGVFLCPFIYHLFHNDYSVICLLFADSLQNRSAKYPPDAKAQYDPDYA